MIRWMTLSLFILCFAIAPAQYDFSKIDKLLKDSLSVVSGTGGGCALIISKDGKTIYSKSFAMPLREYSVDKVVPVASASKWFSAGVIMSMVDSKKFSLDDSIGKFLTGFSAEKQKITIRQLFSHTSGYAGDNVGDTVLTKKNISLDSCVKIISEVPLNLPPGTGLYYGGYGMQVAGRIAELTGDMDLPSGAAWDTLFAQRIAAPLGLLNTNYEAFGATPNPRIAGGIQSSATEYFKYVSMILNNGKYEEKQVLSAAAVNEMLKDQTNNVPIIYSPYLKYDFLGLNPLSRYGIGNWNEIVETNGDIIESGSQGAFGFSPWIDRKRNVAGVLSVFNTLEKVMPTYVELRKIVRAVLDSPTDVKESSKMPADFELLQNYPNPFNPVTTIEYHVPVTSIVKITVYDIMGRRVKELFNGTRSPGFYREQFNSSGLSSGVYFYKLESPDFSEVKKMTILQ